MQYVVSSALYIVLVTHDNTYRVQRVQYIVSSALYIVLVTHDITYHV